MVMPSDDGFTANEYLLAEALTHVTKPTKQDLAAVWGLMTWKAKTLFVMGADEDDQNSRWEHERVYTERIMRAWGYGWSRAATEKFDTDCEWAFHMSGGDEEVEYA